MTTARESVTESVTTQRQVISLAVAATIFSTLHHADHAIRGSHSGWPFQGEVTPFTFSLLIYAFILPGIYLTARGYSIAGYHLFVSVAGLALISFVHFVPVGGHEAPMRDIYSVYDSPLVGLLALVILAGLITSVTMLAVVALRALLIKERMADGPGSQQQVHGEHEGSVRHVDDRDVASASQEPCGRWPRSDPGEVSQDS